MKKIETRADRGLSGTPQKDPRSCSIPCGIAALAQP